jgi:tetratricopeptide (TPR) repeat protein
MVIGVPFELRRRPGAGPVVALLIPTRDPEALCALCARDGIDPSRRVFDVSGGYLLQLEQPTIGPVKGAIRLRALAEALYLPADAELIPALLDDEASGLVRDWGLVFLPGSRALWFDRHSSVELTELITTNTKPRRNWSSLPRPRRLADRLTYIAMEAPDRPPEAIYREFGEDLHGASARTDSSRARVSPEQDDKGRSRAEAPSANPGVDNQGEDRPHPGGAFGSGFLGNPVPGLRGLFQVVQSVFLAGGRAISALREKSEWDWIDQSALLRKLVREFREGDAEKALRRAIPILGPNRPAAVPVTAGGLPWSRAVYNLADLLRRPARGESVGVWPARLDVLRELEREYRKAAERAVRHGDFRRAAYIYGMLLRDDRMAASALKRGGLHHDAATLYLKKLNDPAAAAQAFESAGEVDRAIALYRQVSEFESAGDLLRRIGEADAAAAEYVRAAEFYAALTPPAYFRSGCLIEDKAGRQDLAVEYFRLGWEGRPSVDSLSCAFKLARIHAEHGRVAAIQTLLQDGDDFFGSMICDEDTAAFYNGMVAAADSPSLGRFAEEVRDRALLALAARLRQNSERGHQAAPLVSTFLGRSSLWSAAVVSDAEYAASACRKRASSSHLVAERDPKIRGSQVGRGTVTAAYQAPFSGELFLGFDSGAVLGYRPGSVEVVQIADESSPVTALTVDPEGKVVVAVRQTGRAGALSCSIRCPDGSFRSRPTDRVAAKAQSWLTPIVPWGVEHVLGVGDGRDLVIVDASFGMHWGRLSLASDTADPTRTALLLPIGPGSGSPHDRLLVLTHEGPHWLVLNVAGEVVHATPYYWYPSLPPASTLRSLALTWRHAPPFVELVGLDKNGAVHAAQFYIEDDLLELLAARVATTEGGYLATARSGPSTVVAVSRSRIDWLGYSGDRFRVAHSLKVALPTAIACFASAVTQEILVVCSDGFIARVAVLRRARSDRAGTRPLREEPDESNE